MAEPIAIIGMGCRFSGDATSPHKLWSLLSAGKSGRTTISNDRFNLTAFHHPNHKRPGSIAVDAAYLLPTSSIQGFDPSFFNIRSVEAESMDPHQRKLLEVTYECFESAGLTLEDMAGSKTGVFVGNFTWGWHDMLQRDEEYLPDYQWTGKTQSVLGNRLSYIFDLKGPSFAVDTACSSSLYALHLACTSVRAGECTSAIVGGTNLCLTVDGIMDISAAGMLSPRGMCNTFDSSADGYARGDGVATVLIKRLADAVRDGDPIRAVIRGSAINANGRTPGITHPDVTGQETVIRQAYHHAGDLDPKDTGYVECHGTGTKVGDPIEVEAISNVFSVRPAEDPLYIGSIKTNIGHTEAASGLASLIKVVHILEKKQIPGTIGIRELRADVRFHDMNIRVPVELTPWPPGKKICRASINSFGFGGANSHVVLEAIDSYLPGYEPNHCSALDLSPLSPHSEVQDSIVSMGCNNGALSSVNDINGTEHDNVDSGIDSPVTVSDSNDRSSEDSATTTQSGRKHILVFSAHTPENLSLYLEEFRTACIVMSPKWCMRDLAYTLGARRSHLLHRAYAVVHQDTASTVLAERLRFESLPVNKRWKVAPKVVFVFTGQGAQYAEMGRELIEAFPSVRQTFRELDAALNTVPNPPSWTIQEAIFRPAEASDINEPWMSQPLCTALQIAIVDLLEAWNISPDAVVGHSSGELAAAYAAGFLTSSEAIILSYCRGQAVSSVALSAGSMLAVGLDPVTVQSLLDQFSIDTSPTSYREHRTLGIACYNSPQSVTVSGDRDSITAFRNTLVDRGIFARELVTGGRAYHSRYMKDVGQAYENACNQALARHSMRGSREARKAKRLMVSTVTAKLFHQDELLEPEYWRRNLEQPVLFAQALKTLLQNFQGDNVCVTELGPRATLSRPVLQIIDDISRDDEIKHVASDSSEYLPALQKGQDSEVALLNLAGSLHVRGYDVDLQAANGEETIVTSLKPDGEVVRTVQQAPGRLLVDLPTYSWNYSTLYWKENRWSREWRNRKHPRHDLLGSRIPGTTKTPMLWRNVLRVKDVPWLKEHKIGQQTVFPAAGFVCMAIEAMQQLLADELLSSREWVAHQHDRIGLFKLNNVSINAAITLPEDDGEGVELLLDVRPVEWTADSRSQEAYEFNITSLSSGKWTNNASGRISVHGPTELLYDVHTLVDPTPIGNEENSDRWYKAFRRVGLNYDGAFRGLSKIHVRREGAAEASVSLAPTTTTFPDESPYVLHPATIDNCLQLGIVAAHGNHLAIQKGYLPVHFEEILVSTDSFPWQVSNSASIGDVQATAVKCGLKAAFIDTQLRYNGQPLLIIKRLRCTSVEAGFQRDIVERHPYFRQVWKPDLSFTTAEQIQELCAVEGDNSLVAAKYEGLERLAYLAITQTIESLASRSLALPTDENLQHLHKYVSWMHSCIACAQRGRWPFLASVGRLDSSERTAEMRRLVETLNTTDARLLGHYSSNVLQVCTGEAPAIEILNEHGLWSDFYEKGFTHQGGYEQVTKIAKLLGHKNPKMNILEVGSGTGGVTKTLMAALSGTSPFRQYGSYVFTDVSPGFFPAAREAFKNCGAVSYQTLNIEEDPKLQGFQPGTFDLVVAGNVIHATSDIHRSLGHVRTLLKPGGKLLLLEVASETLIAGFLMGGLPGWWLLEDKGRPDRVLSTQDWVDALRQTGFDRTVALNDHPAPYTMLTTFLATASEDKLAPLGRHQDSQRLFILSTGGTYSELSTNLAYIAGNIGLEVIKAIFSGQASTNISASDLVIIVDDGKTPVLLDLTDSTLKVLQTVLSTTGNLLWVTNGGEIMAKRPKHLMVSGLMRTIGLDNPNLKAMTLDLDPDSENDARQQAEIVLQQVKQILYHAGNLETELAEHNGVVHCSRIVPDERLNAERTQHQSQEKALRPFGSSPLRVDIESPGLLNTIYFKHDPVARTPLESDSMVEIEVVAAGVNMKDLVNFMGKIDQDFFSNEAAGFVRNVGAAVKDIMVGDRVVCLCEGHYGSFVRTSKQCCVKLQDDEPFEDVVTMPVVYATVLYCLLDAARLRKGKTVLIHSGTGGVGIAAIQVAQSVGAEIFATVGNEKKKRYLIDNCSIPEDHIFNSRDRSFGRAVKAATKGQGVDVTLNSTINELLHETVSCLKPFGTHVEIGMRDLLDHGKLDMHMLLGSKTFFHFYLRDFIDHRLDEIERVLATMMKMARSGVIKPLKPVTKFGIDELEKAMRYFSEGKHIGKLVIDYSRKNEALVKVLPRPRIASFNPDAAYLLVGCLGGVGHILSTWMVRNGARNLIFLSRSGGSGLIATKLAVTLKRIDAGVNINFIKGDVASREDVRAAVQAIDLPIRGVIHAAMVLKDNHFVRTTLGEIQQVFAPKVTGSLNLHEEVPSKDLDFFVMTSSMAGTWGSEGQATYAAANVFMDNLARHRRSKGLPATSVALGRVAGVGYVSERKAVKNILKRKGLYGIDEEELLAILNFGILDSVTLHDQSRDNLGIQSSGVAPDALLFSGLEPRKLKAMIDKGWLQSDSPQERDIRFAAIFQALHEIETEGKRNDRKSANRLLDRIRSDPNKGLCILREEFLANFSGITGIARDELDAAQSIGYYGVDSMVGSELRNWIFRELAVDYPLLQLLSPAFSIDETTKNMYGLVKV